MKNSNETTHSIIDDTRHSIIDAIIAFGYVVGDLQYHEFAKKVCPTLSDSVLCDVARHMDRFDDYPINYLFDTIVDYINLSDEEFVYFIEQYVSPNINRTRWIEDEEKYERINNSELVDLLNKYLEHDGYKLVIKDTIGDKNFYECISTKTGVKGSVKNIIFAAQYKPEIVFDDALNNDIRITKNAHACLIYNKPILRNGVMWSELVEWYAEEQKIVEDKEKSFLRRLCSCLDTSFKETGKKSGPETWMLQAYYELKQELKIDLPALIPQVYLYYDPLTIKQRGYKLFEHQKMDFLMIISHSARIVIEIDGKQHYSTNGAADPKLYSEMVKAQREMSLYGYDVYRFGGYEFINADTNTEAKKLVIKELKQFFVRLFKKYNVIPT